MKMKYVKLVLMACFFISGCSKENQLNELNIKKGSHNEHDENYSADVTGKENKSVEPGISPLKRISSKDVRQHIGDSLCVTGLVAEVFLNDKVAYLNMDNKFPKNAFSCAIFSLKFTEFGDLSKYKGKNIEVTGKISTFKNKPQIILNSKDQIKILQ